MNKKQPLTRQEMANRIAMEFQDGDVVNLGIGIPTLCSNFVHHNKTIFYQSENGLVNYGPIAFPGEENPELVNAGGQYVIEIPGMAILDHADSFGLIRSGYVDITVLGAYEVAENGDFANWKLANARGGSIGGAMDLAVGAKKVFLILEHTTKDGQSRLVEKCKLPVTAVGVVGLVATNLGLFQINENGFVLTEIAPGYSTEDVADQTDANLAISPKLKLFRTLSD
ncbi:MAG: succinyl-CoA--3-ketoacid-CoA transferase [Chloroflexi bacterium]|nr:succinyl-CoA--3-ketoacid-CoA transferase [Chloroflexota bacterium]|tara:strand:- start:2848 stop:3525 length:678 start_codon:yes stop_codon:yes gene_type:complete